MKQDLLKKFLVELPLKLNYDHTLDISTNLWKALFYAATDDGQYLDQIFPNISDTERLELTDYQFPILPADSDCFIYEVFEGSYTHPKGSACARGLGKGEPVYRCEDCGFDSSCVLCIYCFNEAAHVGHNVQMYIAREKTNGICDCGDPEAFTDTLDCKCQLLPGSTDLKPLDKHFKSALKTTLRTVLDYILDVTNFSISTLPFIHDNLNKGHSLLSSETLSDVSSLSKQKYGVEDVNSSKKWHLVLWNDEYHNFPEASNSISAATGVDHLKAHEIASDVNSDGRCILKSASSPISLFRALDAVEAGGLVASIVSARDFMREEIIYQMLQWILDILEMDDKPSLRENTRLILGELLLESDYSFAKCLPISLIEDLSLNVRRRCFENGLLIDGGLFEDHGLTVPGNFYETADINRPAHQVLTPDSRPLKNSRVQFLLTFSIRMKSQVRKMLLQIVIPLLLTDGDLKRSFCDQYIEVYPQLLTSLALADREEHLSCMGDISSQLMTCPTSVQYIIENDFMGRVVGPLSQLIEEHAGKWNYDTGYPNFHEPLTAEPMKTRSLYEAISRGLHDANYLVEPSLASTSLSRLLKRNNLIMVLFLLRNFQGYWPIERKYGEHVEREILDFVIHLRYSVPILKIAKLVAEAITDDVEMVKDAATLLINYLSLRHVTFAAPGIVQFQVSEDPVSFVHPVNSLLSYLIQNHDFAYFLDILKNRNLPFVTISDISLRSVVLGSQVKTGFWIRNGISVSRQASLYIDSAMADTAYWRDIHLNQVSAIVDDCKSTLFNQLYKWELIKWYDGTCEYNETVYEDRFSSIAEKFILFVYNLIVDRSAFIKMTKEERVANSARNLISYSLSEGPKSYSSVKDHLDPEIIEHPDFDKWMAECADFQPPSGLVGSGMYRLKSHIYGELDPFSLHLDSSQSQDVSDAIMKYISRTKHIPENEVIITPKIIYSTDDYVNQNIGNFTKTKYFAKLLYKFLQVSLDTKDETFLPHILHLIHAILLDDEALNDEDHIPQSFIDIPICDLLLNIVESTMSKTIVSKANYLLDFFMSKDESVVESLVDCFGKEHIDEFMKTRKGSFESEAEKKKRLASKRNAKVMKKFAKQRKKFLDQNDEYDANNYSPKPETQIEARNCVLCGEPESADRVFGILGSTVNTSILWKIPDKDVLRSKMAFLNYDEKIDTFEGGVYGKGYKYTSDINPYNSTKYDAFVASTCNHGMHYECYRESSGRSNHFSCPLCHTIQNIFVPSFLPPLEGGGIDDESLNHDPVNTRYNLITNSSGEEKSRALLAATVNEKYLELSMLQLRRNLDAFSDDFNLKLRKAHFLEGSSKSIKYFNILQNVSTLIADTIRMNEITSRLDGKEGYTDFIQSIPALTNTLLKSLVQCRALLFELREMPSLLGSHEDLSNEIERFWNSDFLVDGVFNEVIMLYFQTDESFLTLARLGWSKLFTICFYSIISRCRDEGFRNTIYPFADLPLELSTLKDIEKIFDYGKNSFELGFLRGIHKADFIEAVYFAVEKCALPFLRQMLIFKNVLTSSNDGDNKHSSIPEIQELPDRIRAQENLGSSEALCEALGIPSLKDLIKSLAKPDDLAPSDFEFKVYDIVIQAKIPKYLDSGILSLDYPSVITLIDLPRDYMTCLLDYNGRTRSGVYDNFVCLHCGIKVPEGKYYKHMKKCSSQTCIFFHPSRNNFRVITHVGGGPISLLMPGPYLTVHGEVKEPRTSGRASLNEFRYKSLIKLWLNQEIYGFVTRTLYGSRQNAGTPMNNFGLRDSVTIDDESSDEEADFFYSPFAW